MSQPTELAAWGRKSFNLHNQEKWHCLKKGSSKNSAESANNTKDSGFFFLLVKDSDGNYAIQ